MFSGRGLRTLLDLARARLAVHTAPSEPAWHHRQRLLRKHQRELLRAYSGSYTPAVAQAYLDLQDHHGSCPPAMSGVKSATLSLLQVSGRSELQWVCPPCPKHKGQITNDLSLGICRVCGKKAPRSCEELRTKQGLSLRMPATVQPADGGKKTVLGYPPQKSRNARKREARGQRG